ncbi:DUF2889 domain-containing protein [Azospirillum sp. INR13]|uniref:DUF2889 domain-containing protein n=1 Tax=Azospirillum sp. INR13 TaxID=2596919 RepID=UPI00189219EA|nr:DUF2889 domain-containing protein [Azospirillum sp. INR13]MBF5096503.1 DUF2889 domain-containing protein [Azospirillum sp. INR13]
MSEAKAEKAARPNRRPVHRRVVACDAYQRDDGLFDVEATVTDTKPFPLGLPMRVVPADSPLHQMTLRLAVDRQYVIHEVEVRTEHAPYHTCYPIGDRYQKLIGLAIGPGFMRSVRGLFGGALGCTHLTELLGPISTVVFQALWSEVGIDGWKRGQSPVGHCLALAPGAEITQRHFSHLVIDKAGESGA